MSVFLYDLFIRIYALAIRLAAIRSEKARQWIKGRQGVFPAPEALPYGKQFRIWVHCASLGEFEQGRPLIEALKEQWPECHITLTFFSPSGYLIRKNYPHADLITYLPLDTRTRARRFLQAVRPDLVIFVKYEFWYHYLTELRQMDIPTILISAIFRPGQIFFKPYGRLFRRLLNSFDRIFVQEEQSARLLRSLNCPNVEIAGDTRVDRVLDIAGKSREFPLIDRFCAGASILVAGSTWPPDEALLSPFFETHLPENWKVIIAPHEIGERHLREVERLISLPCIRYSRATAVDPASFRILLIDNIGMLSALYRYGHIAYIGGGFGAGIHNILEPVAFELPVVFGPRHQKFSEAVRLIQGGGAFSVADTATFHLVFQKLLQPEVYQEASRQTKIFLKQNRGATRQILNYLSKKFPPGDETVTGR